ncbi:isoprenylcysteine carboxylmethyltransferase family protein [Cognatishimia sp. F0-27]|uniref:isoprenylcysteine carboxylmethyltransferase family protein n=1 Tax=Cognatishimia sp. F0-27 TaxID=2816855 RepID=UPI001D0BFE2C|nr:isoprenylcysteine carboxylmethyltransferase family protein [Cognatishimia sp. F0-27]MCC1492359.1 isoprenylcysteine carboxylmethyltransferase family protein [Cognatishimia sp. F0-27]
MATPPEDHFERLGRLLGGALRPAAGRARMGAALLVGLVTHAVFGVAVIAMIWAMFYGMSQSFGTVPPPWAWFANALLVLQFPLLHTLLLNGRGARLVARVVPGPWGPVLATSSFAVIASLQLAALFLLWTPSGVVWWRAEGAVFWLLCAAYAAAWLLLIKASWDAGAEVQSGALGWLTMLSGRRRPEYPPMPRRGLFRVIRQPIYLSFALTLWTVPIWTPDQLVLALVLTAYCLAAPVLKERRFARRYGSDWHRYKAHTPYMVPGAGQKDVVDG